MVRSSGDRDILNACTSPLLFEPVFQIIVVWTLLAPLPASLGKQFRRKLLLGIEPDLNCNRHNRQTTQDHEEPDPAAVAMPRPGVAVGSGGEC